MVPLAPIARSSYICMPAIGWVLYLVD